MRAKERRKLILERLQQEKRVIVPELEELTRVVTDSHAAPDLLDALRQRVDVDAVG